MLSYTNSGVKIDIWVSNGIYFFPAESATGKTYLFKLLRQLSGPYEDILTVTYDDVRRKNNLVSILQEREYSVVMLDRFDLYQSMEVTKVLNKLALTTTILMDVKGDLLGYRGPVSGCILDLYDSRIEVLPV